MLTQAVLLSCALAAAAAPAPAAGPYKVPLAGRRTLTPRANGEFDGARFLQELNNTMAKYKSGRSLPTYAGVETLQKRATSNVGLTDQVEDGVDELYYGPVNVGTTPVQGFTADFDTGSADFFVPGPQCGAAQGCVGTTKYDQHGTDEHNTTSVTYGSGEITGENYFDTVSVGGLTAQHTNVISLTSAQGFNTSDSNSLMGFGFSTIAQSKQPTFFENLISQGKVTQPEFSFYLGRAASGTQGLSELTLGGLDSSKYKGTFTKVPVTTKGYWQVALDGAHVNGLSAGPTTDGQAAIDTGTTVVIAPTIAAAAIFAEVPGAFPVPLASGSPTETIYAYPCNSPPNVTLQFAGKQFAINKLDFNLGSLTSGFGDLIGNNTLSEALSAGGLLGGLSGGYCAAAIIGADLDPTENLYVVGDTFLKNWYSVYSYAGSASVSFAPAIKNNPAA